MADKSLSELEWKKLSKGKGWKDAALVKALAALEAAASPAEEEGALEQITAEAKALRKVLKGEGAAIEHLETMEKAATKALPAAQARAKSQAKTAATGKESKKGEESAGDEDDEDSPVALTKGLAALLRQVQKGLSMHAMFVTDGKTLGVMVTRKAPTPVKAKVLKDYLGLSAAKPPIMAACLFEANLITFVVEGSPSGLAKKVKAALLAQTELRWKIRVRGGDPNDVDLDDEEAEAGEVQAEQSSEPAAPTEDPRAARYREQLEALTPRLGAALSAQHPEATKLRAVSGYASEKAAAGDHDGALKALAMLAKLLETPVPVPSNADGPPVVSGTDVAGESEDAERESDAEAAAQAVAAANAPPPPAGPSMVALTKARLEWERARKLVKAELQRLEQVILEATADEPDAEDIRAAAPNLYEVLEVADESLIDLLDELLNAEEPARRYELRRQAADKVEAYAAFVASDALVQNVDANPFLPVKVRSTLETTLNQLRAKLI